MVGGGGGQRYKEEGERAEEIGRRKLGRGACLGPAKAGDNGELKIENGLRENESGNGGAGGGMGGLKGVGRLTGSGDVGEALG
jgi:hypothetical protein